MFSERGTESATVPREKAARVSLAAPSAPPATAGHLATRGH